MTTATKKTATAKNTKKAQKATKAPAAKKTTKKTAPKKAAPKKTVAKKAAPKKKAPAKAVKQEKEMTKAMTASVEDSSKTIKEAISKTVETAPVETAPVETVTEKPKKEKKKKVLVKVHHTMSKSRGDKVQKRLRGNSTGKNKWGHKIRSQAAMIDDLVQTGRYSAIEIQIMSGARTKGRIYNHFRALKEKGFPVIQEGGKCKFA